MLIDKTGVLEEGLAKYPSIFIEGAASCGKTTAVNMFLKLHPEATSDVFNMNKKADIEAFYLKMAELEAQQEGKRFLVFENMGAGVPEEFLEVAAEFTENLTAGSNVKLIFVSREKPPVQLLKLMWNGKMGMIYPVSLMFTQAEVTQYVRAHSASLAPMDIYQVTGGWPGCVAMLVTMASQLNDTYGVKPGKAVSSLFARYEVQAYIQHELLKGLKKEEWMVLEMAACCPWVNEELCEVIGGTSGAGKILENLERKGLLKYNEGKKSWLAAAVIKEAAKASPKAKLSREKLADIGRWYESKGAVSEALWCFKSSGNVNAYRKCAIENFQVMDFTELAESDVLEWEMPESFSRLTYLRGMYMYLNQDFAGMAGEIEKVKKLKDKDAAEVYLNLTFAHPEVAAEDWLALLEKRREECAPVRLYHFTENSKDMLTGYREMPAIFACSAKEKKRRMQLLKESLGEKEWLGIELAHLSYSLDLGKKDLLGGEEWDAVLKVVRGSGFSWRFKMACLYLLNKLYLALGDPEATTQMKMLEAELSQEESPLCKAYLQAIHNIYALRGSGDSSATRWLKGASMDGSFQVDEKNYQMVFLMVKGLLAMNQPEIAGRVLRKLTPHVQKYHRSRMLAEMMLQQAIVEWADGKKGAAVRSAVESFLYTGDARYVTFYTAYGQRGLEVLDAYVEWLRNAEPEKWRGKKKYNYGNVLNMPREEYLELLLRQTKRAVRGVKDGAKRSAGQGVHGAQSGGMVENLTLMETIILQNINKGMSNSDICEELNLKLPTVKTHISNLYKKLGVGSRVQAIMKGKEIGILR